MGSQEAKLAQNEALFREVNERVAETASRFARAGGAPDFEFICECADVECLDRVAMTIGEYRHVRSDSTWFLIRPGHAEHVIEVVVERHSEYEIVEKIGEAAATAVALDAR